MEDEAMECTDQETPQPIKVRGSLRVHASKGSDDDPPFEVTLGASDSSCGRPKFLYTYGNECGTSLMDISRQLSRQHQELTQRLDSCINRLDVVARSHENLTRDCSSWPSEPVRSESDLIKPSIFRMSEYTDRKTRPNVPISIADFYARVSDCDSRASSKARLKNRLAFGEAMRMRHLDFLSGHHQPCISSVVKSMKFEAFFACAIISSSLCIGVQLEVQANLKSDETPLVFHIINYAFAVLFLVELTMRSLVFGCRMFWSSDDWLWYWLDLLIVTSSIFEACLQIASSADTAPNNSMSTLRITRIVRVTRLFRVFRVIRIVRFVRALRTLVTSIMCTLRSLMWAMLLLGLVIYIFSITLTQAALDHLENAPDKGDEEENKLALYWGSLGSSMLTLFQAITGGVSWGEASREIQKIGVWWLVVLLVYIIFAYFAVLNVMTGVFCHSAIETAHRDTDMMIQSQLQNKQHYVEKIRQLFGKIDDDNSGTLSLREFETRLTDKGVRALFESMEMRVDDAWTLFDLLDSDKSGNIDVEEFVDGCCRLHGPARSIDLARLSQESRWVRDRLAAFMKYVEAQNYVIQHGLFDDFSVPTVPTKDADDAADSREVSESEHFQIKSQPVRVRSSALSRGSSQQFAARAHSSRKPVSTFLEEASTTPGQEATTFCQDPSTSIEEGRQTASR